MAVPCSDFPASEQGPLLMSRASAAAVLDAACARIKRPPALSQTRCFALCARADEDGAARQVSAASVLAWLETAQRQSQEQWLRSALRECEAVVTRCHLKHLTSEAAEGKDESSSDSEPSTAHEVGAQASISPPSAFVSPASSLACSATTTHHSCLLGFGAAYARTCVCLRALAMQGSRDHEDSSSNESGMTSDEDEADAPAPAHLHAPHIAASSAKRRRDDDTQYAAGPAQQQTQHGEHAPPAAPGAAAHSGDGGAPAQAAPKIKKARFSMGAVRVLDTELDGHEQTGVEINVAELCGRPEFAGACVRIPVHEHSCWICHAYMPTLRAMRTMHCKVAPMHVSRIKHGESGHGPTC